MTNEIFSEEELSSLNSFDGGASGTDESRFIQACIQYYREWLDANEARLDEININQSLVFVYSEIPMGNPGVPQHLYTTSQRVFAKNLSVENGLAVCNENFSIINKLIPEFSDSDAAMSFVVDNFTDDHVFAMINIRQKRIFVHQGQEPLADWCNDPTIIKINTDANDVTPERLEEEIAKFHSTATRTNLSHIARLIWRYDPLCFRDHPELHVQSGLLLYLMGCFRHAKVFVEEEITNSGGRMDIRVSRTHPKKIESIVELKLLDPSRSENDLISWSMKGVTQAHGYKTEFTDVAFACIFDGRKVKSLMPTVIQKANELDVRLCVHQMDVPQDKVKKSRKKSNAC
jgi:hypothetical protein